VGRECEPQCVPPCQHGGACVAPGECACQGPYEGDVSPPAPLPLSLYLSLVRLSLLLSVPQGCWEAFCGTALPVHSMGYIASLNRVHF
jgi:hypothetical protein